MEQQQPNSQSGYTTEDWLMSVVVTVVMITAGAMVDFIMFIASM